MLNVWLLVKLQKCPCNETSISATGFVLLLDLYVVSGLQECNFGEKHPTCFKVEQGTQP